MAKNKAEIDGCLMQYSAEQQHRLEALGIRLFVTIPKMDGAKVDTPIDDFWQSPLGKNIRLAAKNIDISLLPVAKSGDKHFAKRLIWQKIRLLLRSQ
jgi:hypothetical protein